MTDFKIKRGLSTVLFSEPGIVNENVLLEKDCWYLCTDTAELYLCSEKEDESLTLKRINGGAVNDPADTPSTGEGELVGGIIGAYINENGELVAVYSDNTEESLGKVVGKDGLTTTIKVGETLYKHVDGIIELPSFATEEALQNAAAEVDALAMTTAKERYEVIRVPGLEVMHRDDEIRLNTEHVELAPQNVGDGGESNAYYIGIKIYAPANAESIRQNVTSTPGIQEGKEIVPFTTTDVDSYGRKYSTIWVKCAVYQNGAWLNYGMNSTSAKCLGYYYSVEWYDNNGNIIENDSIHVVFTNDACHYSNISDAVSRRFITVEEAIAAINIPETDLSNYYNKSETETLVNEAVNGIEIPEAEIYKVDFNNPNYTEARAAYESGKVLVLVNAAPDINSYALMNYVTDNYITFTKFLMSRSSTYGAFNTYYLRSDNTWEVAQEVKLNKVEITAEGNLQVGKQVFEVPSIDGLATEEYVANAIAGIELPEVPEVNLDGYYTKTETDEAIASAVAEIQHPTTDLSGYALKTEVALKADDIPFTTDKYVKKAVGGFAIDDNLKGLSIAEILAKLLGFQEEPNGLIATIMKDRIAMYQVNENDTIQEVPFQIITYYDSAEKINDGQTGFYQVLDTSDNNKLIEAGYQHFSTEKEPWYIVALPEALNLYDGGNTLAYSWHDLESKWTPTSPLSLTNDYAAIVAEYEAIGIEPPVAPAGYQLWADLSRPDPGEVYRFIIKE